MLLVNLFFSLQTYTLLHYYYYYYYYYYY